MTRFARAKGSKASNEKLENEPTPWHVMKQQLKESSDREKFMKERAKTAKQLLEEREISTPSNTDWAEFEKPKVSKKASKFNAPSKIEKPTEKNIKKKKLKESFQKQKENNSDLVEDVSEKIKVKNQVLRKPEKVEKVEIKVKRTESQIEPSKESTPALKRKKDNQIEDGNKTTEDKVSKKKKKKNVTPQATEENSLPEELKMKPNERLRTETTEDKVPKKKKKKNVFSEECEENSLPEELKVKPTERLRTETTEDKVPKKKKKKNVVSEESEENSLPVSEESKAQPTQRLSKRQKRNLKKKNQNLVTKNNELGNKNSETPNKKPSNSVFDTEENDWNTDVKFGNNNTEKKPEPVKLSANTSEKGFKNLNQFNQEKFGRPNMKNHHLRTAKSRDDKEHPRRKPINSTKLFINGMEIEVVMYDGFPIQKDDAERLKELRQKMILKGSTLSYFYLKDNLTFYNFY